MMSIQQRNTAADFEYEREAGVEDEQLCVLAWREKATSYIIKNDILAEQVMVPNFVKVRDPRVWGEGGGGYG